MSCNLSGKLDTDNEKTSWRWMHFILLVLIVLGIYFTRITTPPLCGDEPRWARVAVEMEETGDWFVPRQQHSPYIDRPPMASYILTLVSRVTGKMDILAIRLPSITAMLIMSIIIYLYAVRFLSPLGAFAAAVIFPTFGQVMQMGQVGENDTVFTFFISVSLLLWHYGWTRSWPATLTWSIGYMFAAMGALQKGLQAPAYFIATVFVYLLIRRQWRKLLTPSHLVGILVFAAVIGAWLIPFYVRTDLDTAIAVWTRTARFRYRAHGFLQQVTTYPIEVWVCLLPWSGLVAGLVMRENRRRLTPFPEQIIFLLTAVIVTFPSVWFAGNGRNRYFMPLFPAIAILLGWMLERFATASPGSEPRKVWNRFLMAVALVIIAAGLILMAAGRIPSEALAKAAQPTSFGVVFLFASALSAVILLRLRRQTSPGAALTAVAIIASFLGLAHTGAYLNAMELVDNDISQAVADIKASLPHPEKLESFGPINHRFAYFYEDPIKERPWPSKENDTSEGLEYFCFDRYRFDTPTVKTLGRGMYCWFADPTLPFQWEQIAALPADRIRSPNPEATVVIGRIIRPDPNTTTGTP